VLKVKAQFGDYSGAVVCRAGLVSLPRRSRPRQAPRLADWRCAHLFMPGRPWPGAVQATACPAPLELKQLRASLAGQQHDRSGRSLAPLWQLLRQDAATCVLPRTALPWLAYLPHV